MAGDPSEQKKKEAESNYSEEGGQIKNIDTVAFVKIKVSPGELGTLFIIKIQYFFFV